MSAGRYATLFVAWGVVIACGGKSSTVKEGDDGSGTDNGGGGAPSTGGMTGVGGAKSGGATSTGGRGGGVGKGGRAGGGGSTSVGGSGGNAGEPDAGEPSGGQAGAAGAGAAGAGGSGGVGGAGGVGGTGGSGGEGEVVCVTADPIVITSDAELRAFAALRCTGLNGDLVIRSSTLRNLDGLGSPSALRVIAGGLSIEDNMELENIEGFRGLEVIHGLNVARNNIEDLDGLESLRSAGNAEGGGPLGIEANPRLTSLSALRNVASSFETIIVRGNGALTSLAGIDHLQTLGALYVLDNALIPSVSFPELEDCKIVQVLANPAVVTVSLPSLYSTAGLQIFSNERLGSVNVTSLTGARTFWIGQNPVLTTLGDLNALASVIELQIWNNPMLPQCFVDALDMRLLTSCSICTGNDTTATCD